LQCRQNNKISYPQRRISLSLAAERAASGKLQPCRKKVYYRLSQRLVVYYFLLLTFYTYFDIVLGQNRNLEKAGSGKPGLRKAIEPKASVFTNWCKGSLAAEGS